MRNKIEQFIVNKTNECVIIASGIIAILIIFDFFFIKSVVY